MIELFVKREPNSIRDTISRLDREKNVKFGDVKEDKTTANRITKLEVFLSVQP